MQHTTGQRSRPFAGRGSITCAAILHAIFGLGGVPADEPNAAYVREIQAIHTGLVSNGDPATLRARLDATDANVRSFEYDYLNLCLAEGNRRVSGDLIRTIAKPPVETRYGVLNPVNRQLVFICRDGGMRIHDLTSPDSESTLIKHPADSAVWTGAFSHDGLTFVSGHQNGEVLIWETSTWKLRQTVSLGAEWPVRELAVSPDGTSLVAESQGALELWSVAGETSSKITDVGERYNFGEGLAFSPTGDRIATGGMFDIRLLDARTGAELQTWRHASYTMGLQFSPDGTRIASAPRGNVNKFLAVFERGRDEPLFNAGPFGNYIAGMAFSPDVWRSAATGCERQLRLFDAQSGEIVLTLDRQECGSNPAFTHDGRLLGWNEPAGYCLIELPAGQTEASETR